MHWFLRQRHIFIRQVLFVSRFKLSNFIISCLLNTIHPMSGINITYNQNLWLKIIPKTFIFVRFYSIIKLKILIYFTIEAIQFLNPTRNLIGIECLIALMISIYQSGSVVKEFYIFSFLSCRFKWFNTFLILFKFL